MGSSVPAFAGSLTDFFDLQTEARLHGAKVVTIAPEYQSSSCKADRTIIIRAGADGALALGLAHVIVRDGLYDADFVKTQTDLPLLIRSDTKKMLLASDVVDGYENADLETVRLFDPGDIRFFELATWSRRHIALGPRFAITVCCRQRHRHYHRSNHHRH